MKLDEVLNTFMQAEENGHLQEAMTILQNAQNEFPDESNYLLSEMAELYYRHDYHLESIRALIKCYRRTKLADIKALLLHRYYQPNSAFFQKNYEENCALLEKYPFFYGDEKKEFATLPQKIIWLDAERVIYLDEEDFQEYYFFPLRFNNIQQGEVVLLSNCFALESIIKLEKFLRTEEILWRKVPFYLYYEPELWCLFLQANELQALIAAERMVYLIGENHLHDFFEEIQAMWPGKLDGDLKKIQNVLLEVRKKQVLTMKQAMKELPEYYAENKENILQRIKAGKVRILFLTSRFSTAVQYHTRDCKLACEELGMETELVIEKSDIYRVSDMYIRIYEFKPDIIFCIDHFRFEFSEIPPEVIFVTWIQDPMPLIVDPNTPGRLGKRDFVLNHVTNAKLGIVADYTECNEILGMIPSNEKIYKPYDLTREEQEKYACDICLVCHACNFSKSVDEFLTKLSDDMKGITEKIAQKYLFMFYEEKASFYSKEEHKNFIEKELEKEEQTINEDMIDKLVEEFHLWIRQGALRVTLVRWLLEAGYTNIKLWGSGWLEQEEFKPYAMGVAENGEVLSKILQSSKINLGNNAYTTGAARVWETMFSGGFYLANYIAPQYDAVDMRLVLQEDEDVKFFYNKQDLLDKVAYYLSHEEERQRMAVRGREKALETMTFHKLMEKMIEEIKQNLN